MNSILFVIIVCLIVAASVLLTIVVLLQNGKGDSMASNFVAGNQTLGVRQTASLLEKTTWGLVTFILVLSIVSAFVTGSNGAQVDITDKIEGSAVEQPAFPAPAQDAPAVQDAQNPATQDGQASSQGSAQDSQTSTDTKSGDGE